MALARLPIRVMREALTEMDRELELREHGSLGPPPTETADEETGRWRAWRILECVIGGWPGGPDLEPEDAADPGDES